MIEERLITCETYGASTIILKKKKKKGVRLLYSFESKQKNEKKKWEATSVINESICTFQR